jgi:hypothetical protein
MSLKKTLLIIAVIVLMIGCFTSGKTSAPLAYAEQFGHQYYWGWRDGYYSWAFSAVKPDGFSWPNDDEGHPLNYWKGVDAGIKYAQDHVMVKVIRGHVLTELSATTHITDWFDGQNQRIWNGTITRPYSPEFMAGYNTTYGTLPPGTDQADYNSGFQTGVSDAHKTSGPIHDDPLSHTELWNNGWGDGYCSVNQNATGKPLDCTIRD